MNESKREDFLSVREAKEKDAAKRRESMAMRTQYAKQVKEVEKELIKMQKTEEKTQFDMRHDDWISEKEYKDMEASKRRESLASRLDTWREHRALDAAEKDADLNQLIEDIHARRSDWEARNQDKAEQKRRERESIANRLDKWREETAQLRLTEIEKAEAEAYEFELRSQEREDVVNYQKQLADDRRESLAYRLASAREDKNWERGQLALLAIAAEESRQLEAEDRACVAA